MLELLQHWPHWNASWTLSFGSLGSLRLCMKFHFSSMWNRKFNTTNLTKTYLTSYNNKTLIILVTINLNSFYKSLYKDHFVGLDSLYKVTGNQTAKHKLIIELKTKLVCTLSCSCTTGYWTILALTAVLSRVHWPTLPTPLLSLATNLPPNSQADTVIITYNAVRCSTTKPIPEIDT